jgi:N-methylhydantoinase B
VRDRLLPLTMSAPSPAILNAPYPLPVLSRHVIGQMLPDMVFDCLRQQRPSAGRSRARRASRTFCSAGSAPRARQRVRLRDDDDQQRRHRHPHGEGRPQHDRDSGGAGRTRGGMGQMIEIRSTRELPFEIAAAFDRINFPPRGRDGGKNGANGYVGLGSGAALRGKGIQMVPAGDRLIVMTPAGGGFRDPTSRYRDAVKADFNVELISEKIAPEMYG